ncbi:hypothetical protein ONS95_002955 [Cadophora gregata]|uniref:uncharacterized protein n=1 Tax=Cadophora gregata TaxID=51156 RepID=UPI0026DC9A60|nr:uncharacterized protein ONS95_002955 [Cadophora gregata]KAK0108133.1 hypothetical protein ONS95_002955 [Cadophora gregata]
MRLINCETGELEWFAVQPPPYSILSHTWDGETEVTYQDYMNFLSGRGKESRKNWAKVERSIEITLNSSERLKYIWIDTCCIDKTDTPELSEAINSMFKWYARATVCYAQIADFESDFLAAPMMSVYQINNSRAPGQGQSHEMPQIHASPQLTDIAKRELRGCRWFTRGWTLQELIAPPTVEFYDVHWIHFGNRNELGDLLTSITSIDKKIFENTGTTHREQNVTSMLSRMTIAKKMSWAKNRQTARTEDIAYSLLGIFGVNMAMTYGEENKAFIRLQKEIMAQYNDLSIFAWAANPTAHGVVPEFRGILAHSPAEFANAGYFEPSRNAIANPDFTLTNNGVKINAQIRNIPNSKYLFLSLNCYDQADGPHNIQGITLQLIGFNKYKRTNPSCLAIELNSWPLQPRKEFFISSDDTDTDTEHLSRSDNQSFVFDLQGLEFYEKMRVSHDMAWDDSTTTFNTHGLSSFNGCVWFRTRGRASEKVSECLVACGTATSAQEGPWLCVVTRDHAVYKAAMDQNWEAMGSLGRKAGRTPYTGEGASTMMSVEIPYDGKDIYEQKSGLRISAFMVRETGTKFRIRVQAEPFDHASGCDNCLICCCDPRAADCSGNNGSCVIL